MIRTILLYFAQATSFIFISTVSLPAISNANSHKPAIQLKSIKPKATCGCFAWKGNKILTDNKLIYEESGADDLYYQPVNLNINGKMVSFRLSKVSAIARYHNGNKFKRNFSDTLKSKLYEIKSEWKTTKIVPGPDGNESRFNVKFTITNTVNKASRTIYAVGYCGC